MQVASGKLLVHFRRACPRRGHGSSCCRDVLEVRHNLDVGMQPRDTHVATLVAGALKELNSIQVQIAEIDWLRAGVFLSLLVPRGDESDAGPRESIDNTANGKLRISVQHGRW